MKKKYVVMILVTCMLAASSVLGVSAATTNNAAPVMDMARGGTGQFMGGFGGGMNQSNVTYASESGEIVTSDVENTASKLVVDEANASTIVMSDTESQVKIDSAGTYIITGSCSDGNITVKKGTTGVVLILKDLNLTSTTGATVSCNKGSEVKIVIDGDVTLTDAENPEDETSTDTEVADAFDGAALKIKDGANVYLTGDGTLNIDATSCKNGIKVGDADTPSFVIDGDLTVNIDAANDGINAGYDLTILNGNINISSGDDAIHADRILTIGNEDGSGPEIMIEKSGEGLEGSVVNLFGGSATVNSSDDAINAANKESLYANEMVFSINVTGGDWTIKCSGDGLDSNGNINLIGGSVSISSASMGGEAGIDYDGAYYVSDDFDINNTSGVSGPDMMGRGMMQNGSAQKTQKEMKSGEKDALTSGEDADDTTANSNTDSASGQNGMNGMRPKMQGNNGMQQAPENMQEPNMNQPCEPFQNDGNMPGQGFGQPMEPNTGNMQGMPQGPMQGGQRSGMGMMQNGQMPRR